MKFSEAIILGSTMMNLNPNAWYYREENCGCLIGMGMKASGSAEEVMDSEYIVSKYPWMANEIEDLRIPEKVRRFRGDHPFDGSGWPAETVIAIISTMAHLAAMKEMSVEEAVDWVRTVEPQEEQTDGGQGPVQAALEVTTA